MIEMLLITTARVLALPTSTEPPFTLYPIKLDIEVIRKAKTTVFIIAKVMENGSNHALKPTT